MRAAGCGRQPGLAVFQNCRITERTVWFGGYQRTAESADQFFYRMVMRIIKRFFILCLTFLFLLPALSVPVQAASSGTIVVSVEKFTLGQGYLVEPTRMSITEGETYDEILLRFAEEQGIELIVNSSGGFYLAGIRNADGGNSVIPFCVEELAPDLLSADHFHPAEEKNERFPDLSEFSYTRQSGWMYCVDNYFPEVGMNAYRAMDGDVVRIRYTIYGLGLDLGSSFMGEGDPLELPDLDAASVRLAELGRILAETPDPGRQAVYDAAIRAVSDMDHSQNVVDAAVAALDAAITGNPTDTVLAGLESLAAYEDEQIRARREGSAGTPDAGDDKPDEQLLLQAQPAAAGSAKAKLSAKALKNHKASLTWKKITLKYAVDGEQYSTPVTGYQVYRSAKKNSGYKKIKTITKAGTVKFTDKKLKKGKTYYYKLRPYLKTGGKTYTGKWSNIVKVRAK